MKRRTKGVFYLLGLYVFLIGLLVGRPMWQARRPSGWKTVAVTPVVQFCEFLPVLPTEILAPK
jgi:hypothetical protein